MLALLRDQKRDVRRERERGAVSSGRRTEHAAGEHDQSLCATESVYSVSVKVQVDAYMSQCSKGEWGKNGIFSGTATLLYPTPFGAFGGIIYTLLI